MPARLAFLLLGDGRFPAGGHAHSGGVESAVADGRVVDVATLGEFVHGRLVSTGLVDAALAAATFVRLDATATDGGPAARAAICELDAEAGARVVAPALRAASRKLGRQLARVADRCWPSAVLAVLAEACPTGAHLPVAMGAVGVAAALDEATVARLAVHHAITTPAQAGVRLLGLDPYAVAALCARLEPAASEVVSQAVDAARGQLADLPALAGPIVDIAAVEHRQWDMRMFAT